jgi:hypothetical protein
MAKVMAARPQPAPPVDARATSPGRAFVFRFAALYLGLFILATQISGSMLPNPFFEYNGLGRLWPMRQITEWVGRSAFGITEGLDPTLNGEPLFFWVQTAWILGVALLAALAWTAVRRGRQPHMAAHPWFRLLVRLALAASLLEYGMTKVIPTQFPAPSLVTLVTPAGDLTLSALLWTSIGASPVYQIFTGCVEVLGGLLLLTPRVTLLGTLVSLAAVVHVFVLNMTYDIGLKLVSLHLVVMALVLLAPDLPRLADFFWRHRPTTPREEAPLLRGPGGRRTAVVLPVVFGACLLAMYAYINVRFWQTAGDGAPDPPLHGIWNVAAMSIDGAVRPPVTNDYDRRWRRLIFDEPGTLVIQRTDDSFARYGAAVDLTADTLGLTKAGSRRWRAAFRIDQPSPARLILEGEMDGQRIRAELERVEADTLRLLNSTFRWVRGHEP